MESISHPQALQRLMQLDSCALSDALDQLSLLGCVTGLTPAATPTRIGGRVHTVSLAAGEGRAGQSRPRHLCTTAIEACDAGEIIVIEQRTGIEAGCWGGMLSRGAVARRVAGVIADGLVRDVDEARQLGFAIFSRGYTARTARGRIHEAATDVPVQIADVIVHPGDYAFADSSAVIFVRPDHLGAVLNAAERIAARESVMVQRLAAGHAISEVLGADYEHMLKERKP
jgi:4-hydroxy-4-methyl-2-oxoglutarate aldolase